MENLVPTERKERVKLPQGVVQAMAEYIRAMQELQKQMDATLTGCLLGMGKDFSGQAELDLKNGCVILTIPEGAQPLPMNRAQRRRSKTDEE